MSLKGDCFQKVKRLKGDWFKHVIIRNWFFKNVFAFQMVSKQLVPPVTYIEAGQTGAEWLELPRRDHFFTPPFHELVDLLERNVSALS